MIELEKQMSGKQISTEYPGTLINLGLAYKSSGKLN